MSAEHDGDDQMLSSPEESDNELLQQSNTSVPSPPDSTYRSHSRSTTLQSAQPLGSSTANSNGKRPLVDISNGKDDADEQATTANSKTWQGQEFATKTHEASGYTWNRLEDEPGYIWSSKRALDEQQRALENIVHHEFAVKNKYGDPFQIAEQETALQQIAKENR